MFERIKPNSETVKRDWLVYSPTTKKVYCFCCKLLSSDRGNASVGEGFNNWKNADYITKHETSAKHTSALIAFTARRKVVGRIDTSFEVQYLERRDYWRNV